MSVRINDINVIDGFLLPDNGYTLHPNSDFTYEFNFDIDNMIDVNKDQVDTYYDSKFGSILEDFRLSELSTDDTKSVLTDVELLSKLTEIETDVFGDNDVSKLNNVKSIDIDL